jgi:hypothetical protein
MPAMALKIADFDVLDSYITIGESFDVNVSVCDDGTLGDLTSFGFDVDPLSSLTLFPMTTPHWLLIFMMLELVAVMWEDCIMEQATAIPMFFWQHFHLLPARLPERMR